MKKIKAYAALKANEPLQPFKIFRREIGSHDVLIDIQYCGVCHTDIHQVREEWGPATFPMVPGHEIVGTILEVGSGVSKFKKGDLVGVGCMVGSCKTCSYCNMGLEQYCNALVTTYNSIDKNTNTPTYGGYSTHIVVDEDYVLALPKNLPLAQIAPLLCAGITNYAVLKHWKVKPGDKVAIVGLGGLGHVAVKLAAALGAEVTVFSTSDRKRHDALRFGATHVVNSIKENSFNSWSDYFDLIIYTAAGHPDLTKYLSLLKLDATLVLVSVPGKPLTISAFPLIEKRRYLAGSSIGGIKETQEMLDLCGKHNIVADIEIIPITQINEAYERMIKGDVFYRFVIDLHSFK